MLISFLLFSGVTGGTGVQVLVNYCLKYFRVPLDDKLYQRDLEVALALSVSEPTLGTCKVKDSQEQG